MSGLCSGCGVCTALCPTGARTMVFDEQGGMFLPRPDLPSCTGCGICLKVCPFTPANPPTPTLTQRLYAAVPGVQHDDVLGYYLATHVGYSEAHRLTSASGGLATWLLEHLLSAGAVDAVLSVGPDAASPTLFNYRACRSALEVRACSGSCYQPVHLGRVLGDVLRTEGRYAVVALPCVARALRLATVEDPRLRSRLVFVVGLVCGQMKSRHYAEYLCARCGGAWPPTRIAFRTKRPDRPASDYACTLSWDGVGTEARTAEIGWTDGLDMAWSGRLFTLEACDHCDDVFAECADVALMDAWLPALSVDWRGGSIAIVRNHALDALLRKGRQSESLLLEDFALPEVLASQGGVVRQKRALNPLYGKGSLTLRTLDASPGLATRLDAWIGRNLRIQSRAAWAAARGDLRRFNAALRPLLLVVAVRSALRRVASRLRSLMGAPTRWRG